MVYVESQENETFGNKNPITVTKLFMDKVKGIVGVHRVNAHKIDITLKTPAPANNLLKMDSFLGRKPKAFVPAHLTETFGRHSICAQGDNECGDIQEHYVRN
ncbi:unnamed protein product [Pieris brassicae]|uniref:Uncharacterized protein n=1 Tax=Pieris brassicae TaxID=7116 RepID=A0A9P0XHA6_PIEBR|nr:unnamed protein product [Pieris brassicae]